MDRDHNIASEDTADEGVDPLLTRVASRLLGTHRADLGDPARCAHPRCRRPYPCRTALLAREALSQAAGWATAGRLGTDEGASGLIGAAAGDGAP